MTDVTKVTPEVVYTTAADDNGKTVLAELAKNLGIGTTKFQTMLLEYAAEKGLVIPQLKFKDEPKPRVVKPARIFERGNSKQNLSLSSARLAYYGFTDELRWESAPVAAGSTLTVMGAEGPVVIELPRGAIVVYPTQEAPAEPKSEPETEAKAEKPAKVKATTPAPAPVESPIEGGEEETLTEEEGEDLVDETGDQPVAEGPIESEDELDANALTSAILNL